MGRLNRKRCDASSMSNYVIKKWCRHGAMENLRSRPTITRPSTRGHDAERRCRMSKIHRNTGQIVKDPQYRESQEEHGWDEEECDEMDKLTQEDHSYKLTKRSEYLRYSSNWCVQLGTQQTDGHSSLCSCIEKSSVPQI